MEKDLKKISNKTKKLWIKLKMFMFRLQGKLKKLL